MINRSRTRLAAAFLGAALASGCAKGPPPKFYMMQTPAATEPAGLEQGVTIGVGPVNLPAHLDRNQIVSRETGVKLDLSEREQWAEPVKDGVSRVLAVQLALTLDSNRIFVLPLRRRRALDFQVAVDVLRLDGTLGGDVILGARWSILSGDGKKLLISQVSRVEESTGVPEVAAYVEAQSRAVARLGEEIGTAIKERFF
jgi:uncharacterized lipoprotein YmbA